MYAETMPLLNAANAQPSLLTLHAGAEPGD